LWAPRPGAKEALKDVLQVSSKSTCRKGITGDINNNLIPVDDGEDGKTDPAVYDPLASVFYAWLSGSNYRIATLSW